MKKLTKNTSEKELIGKALCKDNDAISQLYLIVFPMIKYMVQKIVFRSELVPDIVSDLVIKILYEKLHLFNPEKGELKSFVQKICYNHCVDLSRRKKARFYAGFYRILPDAYREMFIGRTPSPLDILISTETTSEIKKLWQRLKPAKKELLFRVVNRTNSLTDLAKELGCNAHNISTTVSRLKREMRLELLKTSEKTYQTA